MRKRLRSFYYANKGIQQAIKEPNFRIQLVVAAGVVLLGTWLEVSRLEWVALVICIAMVLSAEIFNSSIESLTDAVFPNQDKRVERIKDMAAGAVWVLSIGSAVVGILILGPKLWAQL